MITAHPHSTKISSEENFQAKPKVQSVSGSSKLSKPSRKTSSKKSATAFRTISEVATGLDVQQHVLRFWETKFSQVRPMKRGGGRRYYRPEDVALLKRIHHLLYTEGYTIKGVQKLLKGQGKQQIIAAAENENAPAAPKVVRSQAKALENTSLASEQRIVLEAMLAELKALRAMID